jgi:hypothetical protein
MTLAQKLYEVAVACRQLVVAVPFERQPVELQALYEALAEAATLHLTGSDASVSAARVEELLDLLAALVKQRKGIEFSTTEEQATWRKAKAVLVRSGR